MGTRNLTCVVEGGKFRIAQYGQWDGYPEGQGATILNFLKNRFDESLFRRKLALLRVVSDAEIDALPKDTDNATFSRLYPMLNRDIGGEILEKIQNAPPPVAVQLSTSFAADSLCCEWCYVVDLDQRTFEAYAGGKLKTLHPDERFAFLDENSGDYGPVRFLVGWSLAALPDEKDFIKSVTLRDIELNHPEDLEEYLKESN